MLRRTIAAAALMIGSCAAAAGLTAQLLGVVYDRNDPASVRTANYYAQQRHVPATNLVGLAVPQRAVINRAELAALRTQMLKVLPTEVQALLLVWSKPYAVECMSVTTAFAAGYQQSFCEPGCEATTASPLFDDPAWLPADTVGWLPAMLLPSADEALARTIIDRGVAADNTRPAGTAYLVKTRDARRNVRAVTYPDAVQRVSGRLRVQLLETPVVAPVQDVLAYFTGVRTVDELPRLVFLPGAIADHLTSTGGAFDDATQMSALEWLRHGATATYGTVSEPCNVLAKFPLPAVLLDHYLRGDSALEAYWKSVGMPGQGLFIGEPLAAPYRAPRDP